MNPLASLVFLGVGQSNMSPTFLRFSRCITQKPDNLDPLHYNRRFDTRNCQSGHPAIPHKGPEYFSMLEYKSPNLYLASTHFNHNNFVPIPILWSFIPQSSMKCRT